MTIRIYPDTTMASEVVDDVLTIVYPHADYPGTRTAAAALARQYGRDHRKRAGFIDSTDIDGVQTFRYRLGDPHARLRAMLADPQNH